MKVLVYGDVHHGCFAGKLDRNGFDVRVNDTLKVEYDVTQYCVDNGITVTIFDGDRFESRNPPLWLTNLVDEAWMDRIRKGINIISILGNHDSYRVFQYGHSYSRLWADVSGLQLYDKPGYLTLNGKKLALLPWGYPLSDLKEPADVLFFHEAVVGHEDERGYKPFDGYDYDEIRSKAKIFLGGHIHSQERIGATGAYVGNPYQKDRLDIGKQRGFVLLDMDTLGFEFVAMSNPQIKEFTIKDESELVESEVRNNYVRCIVKLGKERAVEKRLREMGARFFVISVIKERGFLVQQIAKGIYKQDKVEPMIHEYVSSREVPDKNLAKEIGNLIWKESGQ